MLKRRIWAIGIVMLGVLAAATPLRAQDEPKEKPPLYIYVSQWAVPRAQWGDMAKLDDADGALMDKLVADGTITGYGETEILVHTEGGPTHASWFEASSQAGILKALQTLMSQPETTAPVLAASKHFDLFLASRLYNYRPGTYEGAYLHVTTWELKPGEYDAFVGLVKARVAPLLDKLIADGVVIAYNLNYQEVATQSSDTLEFVTITKDASGSDKVSKAFEGLFGKDPEIGPAMRTLVKAGSARGVLSRVSHMTIK
jgi:hypothetical protein